MKHGSLFSGIGGFDLASEWMGWENVFHCEWNEFGKRVLKYYWPNAISYDDITKTDFTIHRGRIDILTGGFPCQPFSMAGKRKGTEDDRHLWPEMLRAIREIQPRFVVGENVPGLVNWDGGLVFEQVQADLEAEGYQVQTFILPACGVNAPHRRDRVWFVANTRFERQEVRQIKTMGVNKLFKKQPTSNSDSCRRREDTMLCKLRADFTFKSPGNCGDTNQGENEKGQKGGEWGHGAKAIWNDFPTQPPVRSRNDGIPSELAGITVSKHRNESIKGYGNAIVPQVVYQIFKAIEQFDNLQNP